MKKLVVLVVVASIIAFFSFGFHEYLSLEALQSSAASLIDWHGQNPLLVGAVFFVTYVAITAVSLPGAVIMTLAAGAIFGLWWGVLLVSFASSIGATLAFLTSRYLFRTSVQARFGQRLKTINKGIEREGVFYLFSLRLIPAFPFFLVNLVMGLTPISTLRFYAVSQLGMLAATIVFVNAGTQLAAIDSLSGVLSPSIALAFLMLGILPLLAKRLVDVWRARSVYKKWQRPARYDRNLIVIGAGAGGLVSAYIAAAVKAKVTLIEAHKMGGDCLNYGCVPSKAIIKSANVAHQIRNSEHYGLNKTEVDFSFKKIMQRVEEVIQKIEPHDSIERYTGLGVEVLQGYAKLIDPWTVEIEYPNGEVQKLTARSIVLATGAKPFVPPLPGIDDVGYLTSDTLWGAFSNRESPPKKLVVLGGGPIGCELSQCFARFGSRVTQVEMAPRILSREDAEVSVLVESHLKNDGVEVLTGHQALRCHQVNGKKYIIVKHQQSGQKVEESIQFDELICAVGRRARLEGYGLDKLGIETQGTIITNEYLQTRYPNIFAVGDVVGPYQFTHVAAHQAWYAAVNGLFGRFKKFAVDYRVIPWTTFVDPEVARVGLNEQDALEKNIPFEVSRYPLNDLDRAITDGADYGFVKVLTVPGKDKILGVTIVGDHAGDLLAEFVLAMKWGLGLNKVLSTIHSYPTWAEANKYVAGEWKRAHTPKRLLQWVAKYHRWQRG